MKSWIYFLGAGLGLGWLMGLSVAPTAQSVVGAVLAAAVALGATLGSPPTPTTAPPDETRSKKEEVAAALQRATDAARARLTASAGAFCALAIGLGVGSTMGVVGRTHHWLEPTIAEELARWPTKTEESRLKVMQALLDADLNRSKGQVGSGVLFSGDLSSLCERAKGLVGESLRSELETGTKAQRAIAKACKEDECIQQIIQGLCSP